MSLLDAVIFGTVITQIFLDGIFGQLCGNKTVLITVRDGAGTYVLNDTDSLRDLFKKCNKKKDGKHPCFKKPDNKSDIFYLFTKQVKNPDRYEVLKTNNKLELERSNFNKNLPTMLFFPGWLDKEVNVVQMSSVMNISRAALNQIDANVIVVDWNVMTEDFVLVLFREHVLPIAHHCRKFLTFLINEGMKPEEAHIIAFSLGVHVVAMSLENFRHKIGRFTALDPLGIVICDDLFERNILRERIGRSLAGFVDVIHTSKFGTNLPSGHVDFYVDGGTQQHHCGSDPFENAICSHQRACTYFANSILIKNRYEGIYCDSYGKMLKADCNGPLQVMGYDTPKDAHGIYYVPVDKFLIPKMESDKNIATFCQKNQLWFVLILCFVFHWTNQ